MANDVEIGEICERLSPPLGPDLSALYVASNDLGHLDAEQVGSMHRLLVVGEAIGDGAGKGQPAQQLDGRRGVKDDQRASRSDLTASAAGSDTFARSRA